MDCESSGTFSPGWMSDGSPALQGREEERHHGHMARIRHSMGTWKDPMVRNWPPIPRSTHRNSVSTQPITPSSPRPVDLLKETLTRAVVLATGNPNATPRIGQLELAKSILETMSSGAKYAAEAPTGSGKSFAAGVPAMLRAALEGERTVISTETLGLQSQLIDKDLPVVAQAVKDVVGCTPTFAVLKGWSNYVCAASAVGLATEQLGVQSDSIIPDEEGFRRLLERLGRIDGFEEDGAGALLRWALRSVAEDTSGDLATFPGHCSTDDRQRVSVSSAECIGVKECFFGSVCRPEQARLAAGTADVLVTNHAMIGVQAVTKAPVVIGNKRLGPIDHLVVDEAHGLPNVVRNQGAVNIGAVPLLNLLRIVERVAEIHGPRNTLRLQCFAVGVDLDNHLAGMLKHLSVVSAASIETTDGWESVVGNVRAWLDRAKDTVPEPLATRVPANIRARKAAISKIDELIKMLGSVESQPKEFARWVEFEHVPSKVPQALAGVTGATLHISPVDVGPMLQNSVYSGGRAVAGPTRDDTTPDEQEGGWRQHQQQPPSVTLLSATLPQSVVATCGLWGQREVYPSPFIDAYDNSLLFIPKVSEEELDQISPKIGTGRRKFNTTLHAEWAAGYIAALVGANRGSALVLSATTTSGKQYAERLRQQLHTLTVYSQWDGGGVRQVVDAWREDTGSVLVGTRSLMTGVDAPGGTCTMVILDRAPRAASNPVDDARSARLMERLDIDQWQADRMVYVADAALLIEQAAGRLIRSTDDSGVVALLDPRMLQKNGVIYQGKPTVGLLLGGLERFAHRTSSLALVQERLAERRTFLPGG